MNATRAERPPARLIALNLLFVGLAVNQWSLAWVFSRDEFIESFDKLLPIWGFQAGVLLLATLTGAGWRPTRLPSLARGALVVLLGATWVAGAYGSLRAHGYFASPRERLLSTQMRRMNASEALHLNLSAERLAELNVALMNLELPSLGAFDVFTDEVLVGGLERGAEPILQHEFHTVGTRTFDWSLARHEQRVARGELALLRPLLDTIQYFQSAKFYFVGGDFVADDSSSWRVAVGLKGLARGKNGNWVKLKGKLELRWSLDPGFDASEQEDFQTYAAWRVDEFIWKSLATYETREPFFSEELAQAVDDPQALDAARRNLAQEMIVEMLLAQEDGQDWQPPHEFYGHQASWRHPSVSVVDIDHDGFDDFYAMARYGRNLLFHNRADGTFEEIAADVGLDIVDHTGVALFADFDNDGDDDVFLGRSVERSQYLENVGDARRPRFEDRSRQVTDTPLPHFSVTASAVDYDRDGLLDLYVGTYGAQLLEKDVQRRGRANVNGMLLADYLSEAHARELFRQFRQRQQHKVRDRVGPPNLLFHNEGAGRLALLEDTPLTHYRNTFQASFVDYDDDGDPDVYVANDFAPNAMFRNHGGAFVDVTRESNAQDVGFGMGISWGDYDKDGDPDAYVSNMYSKAGNRILPMVEGVNDTFMRMAAGNSLLRLDGTRFERISSLDGQGMHVEMGGWSWGSMWVDFDNDSWLDVYSLSGYYSAPKEIAAGHDL